MQNKYGRPKIKLPSGFLSIADAAARSGVSYATVYSRVRKGDVESRKFEGIHAIHTSHLAELKRDREPTTDRRAVNIRSNPEQYARWVAAAGDQPLSRWLASLADAAAVAS